MKKRIKRIIKFRSSRTRFVVEPVLSTMYVRIKQKRGELNRLIGLSKIHPESKKIRDHIKKLKKELKELEEEYYKLLVEKRREE